MEEQPGGSSSGYGSYNAVQLIIPPPPSQNENSNTNDDGSSGIANPSSVRNLKDILKYTTQMTNIAAKNEANGIIDLTLDDEVSLLLLFTCIQIFRYRCLPTVIKNSYYLGTSI